MSIVLGGVAGICIAIGLLWNIWGVDPFGIFKRQAIVQLNPEPVDPEPVDPEPVDPEPTDPEPADPKPADEPSPSSPPTTLLEDSVPSRLPVPPKKAREKSQALLDEIFKERYDETTNLEASQRFDALKELATEIYSLHRDEDDPITRFVILEMAVRIATESGDPTLTTEIIDEFNAQFEVDDLSRRATAVNLWAKQAAKNFRNEQLQQKRLQLLNLMLPLAERAESEYRFRIASKLYILASKQINGDRKVDFLKIGRTLKNRADIHDRMIRLAKELKSPDEDSSLEDNAEKHETVGIYLCFTLDDWQTCLVHLAASNSADLSEIAQLDLDSQANLEGAEAVGDRWWDLKPSARFFKYKDQLKARAAYWYALAIGDRTGIARKKLEKRIEETGFVLDENGMVQKAAPSLPGKTPPLAVAPFDGRQAQAHQKAWARYLSVGKRMSTRTRVEASNSIGMQFVLIPPGEFTMGSPESEPGRRDDETQHLVRITKPFYLSAYEVTQAQYEQEMGSNPSSSKGDTKPVELVNWHDAVAFFGKLSEREGVEYRLPTEAEWEYACRAGTTTAYSFGDDVRQLPQYAWCGDHAKNTTHPVGEKLPNAWGLFGMHGNVREWCQDRYGPYESLKVLSDPTGPALGSARVLRGGAFFTLPLDVRAAFRRFSLQPVNRYHWVGFRLARTYDLSPAVTVPTVDKPGTPPAESSPTTEESFAALEKLGAEIGRNAQGEIVRVILSGTQITDAGLVHLAGLTSLESLRLKGTQVTDAGLVHLKGLTELRSLFLNGTQVTDAGLVHLKGLTSLEKLYLRYTQVTDTGLEHLKGLTNLETLALSRTQVTDAGLVHLAGMTKLKGLSLNDQVTDAGLEHLKGLTKLEGLNLNETQVTDAGLVHLAGLTKLKGLVLNDTQVTDAGVAELKKALPRCHIQR
jgi:formylglycine-generating enzyme required for sulfatase activity/dsDNA-binding SOS-regulon protein